jgi:hypothetical protein
MKTTDWQLKFYNPQTSLSKGASDLQRETAVNRLADLIREAKLNTTINVSELARRLEQPSEDLEIEIACKLRGSSSDEGDFLYGVDVAKLILDPVERAHFYYEKLQEERQATAEQHEKNVQLYRQNDFLKTIVGFLGFALLTSIYLFRTI